MPGGNGLGKITLKWNKLSVKAIDEYRKKTTLFNLNDQSDYF